MAPGSVVVDLAAERGGNCELTRPDETVVHNGVTIIGPSNPPALVPYHASQMYSKNITTFLMHLLGKDGAAKPSLAINLDDEITRETLLTHQGAVVHARVRELRRLRDPARRDHLDHRRRATDAELPFTFRHSSREASRRSAARRAPTSSSTPAWCRASTAGSRRAPPRSRSSTSTAPTAPT